MIKTNFHTHCVLCLHASKMPVDYAKYALENGFTEIGFSDHGYIPRSFMSYDDYIKMYLPRQMTRFDFENVYLSNINLAQKLYGDKIKIYKGLEIEYLYGKDDFYLHLLSKLDYLNLGIHYYSDGKKLYNSYDGVTKDTLKYYVQTAIDGMKTGFFKILVHPDLFMFNYQSEQGPLIFDEVCEKECRRLIEASIKYNVALEINCGGTQNIKDVNGKIEFVYPRSEFWNLVKEYKKARVIIGADAHSTNALNGENVEKIIQFSQKIGLEVISSIF